MPREVLKRRPKAQTFSKWTNDLSSSNTGAALATSTTESDCADRLPKELNDAIRPNKTTAGLAKKAAQREPPDAVANFREKVGLRTAATNHEP